ncbi:MAG: SDR family NAD(P)-dependent oxidoreductase [Fimbriimonas sp.]
MAVAIDLTGRVALVTGAGAGIGRATSLRLAEAGATVWVTDLDLRAAEEVAATFGGIPLRLDVSDPDAITQAASEVGCIDILVNNAGFDYNAHISQTPLQDWIRVHDTHLRGMFLVTQAFAPNLAPGASVVMMASVHGLCTEGGQAAYASAKAGILGLTRALAIDLGPQVRVNAIAPGYIETRLMDAWLAGLEDPEPMRERIRQIHPLGRWGQPSEVADAVLYLASPLSSFVTGSTLVVDGGMITQFPF